MTPVLFCLSFQFVYISLTCDSEKPQMIESSQAANPTIAIQAPINVNIFFSPLFRFEFSYCECCLLSEDRRENASHDICGRAYAEHYITECDHNFSSFQLSLVNVVISITAAPIAAFFLVVFLS